MKAVLTSLKKCVDTDEPLISMCQLSGQQPCAERASWKVQLFHFAEFNLCVDYHRKLSARGQAGLKPGLPVVEIIACSSRRFVVTRAALKHVGSLSNIGR